MFNLEDFFSSGLDETRVRLAARRLNAGIPMGAAGPWDGALEIAEQARNVATKFRNLK